MTDFAGYKMTLADTEKLIMLKHQLEEVTEKVMMSQCRKICPYQECLNEKRNRAKSALIHNKKH